MYKQLANQFKCESTFRFYVESIAKGVDLPNAKDVVYADLLVLDQGDRVYFLFQTQDQNCINYQMCQSRYKEYNSIKMCKIDQFHVPFMKLIRLNLSQRMQLIRLIHLYNFKMESFLYKQLSIRQVFEVQEGGYQKIFAINQNVHRQKEYNGTFNSKAVFGNAKIRGQIIFIQTQEEILIGEFANGNNIHFFHLTHIIPVIPKSEISILLVQLNLLLFRKQLVNKQQKNIIGNISNQPLQIRVCNFISTSEMDQFI